MTKDEERKNIEKELRKAALNPINKDGWYKLNDYEVYVTNDFVQSMIKESIDGTYIRRIDGTYIRRYPCVRAYPYRCCDEDSKLINEKVKFSTLMNGLNYGSWKLLEIEDKRGIDEKGKFFIDGQYVPNNKLYISNKFIDDFGYDCIESLDYLLSLSRFFLTTDSCDNMYVTRKAYDKHESDEGVFSIEFLEGLLNRADKIISAYRNGDREYLDKFVVWDSFGQFAGNEYYELYDYMCDNEDDIFRNDEERNKIAKLLTFAIYER